MDRFDMPYTSERKALNQRDFVNHKSDRLHRAAIAKVVLLLFVSTYCYSYTRYNSMCLTPLQMFVVL